MRENMGLFRGKRADNCEWVEGGFVKKTDPLIEITYCLILVYGKKASFVTWYPVDHSTVGECTGLKDKNGKLIFEGDIVKGSNIMHSNRKIYQVAFDDGAFCLFDCKGVGWHHSHIDNKEVIGNIHDNDLGDFDGY